MPGSPVMRWASSAATASSSIWREKGTDRGGNLVRIGSKIILTGNIITVDFEVEFNASGEILTASVPFTR